MAYFLIIILQLLGIGFHVGKKVLQLDKEFADDSLGDVFRTFWKSDRITVFISVLILAANLVGHFIIAEYAPELEKTVYLGVPYMIWAFGVALVLGYGGQAFFYKLLGKAQQVLIDKADLLHTK